MKQSRPILNQSFLFKGKLQLRLIISKFKRLFDSISSINLSEVLYYLLLNSLLKPFMELNFLMISQENVNTT